MKYITTREAAAMLRVSQSHAKTLLGNAHKRNKQNRFVVALYDYEVVKALQESRAKEIKLRNDSRKATKSTRYNKPRKPEDDPYGVMIKVKTQERSCPKCGGELLEEEYTCPNCKNRHGRGTTLDLEYVYGSILVQPLR